MISVDSKGAKLFDIPADPSERTDLSKTHPEIAIRMRAEFDGWKEGVMKELEAVKGAKKYPLWALGT